MVRALLRFIHTSAYPHPKTTEKTTCCCCLVPQTQRRFVILWLIHFAPHQSCFCHMDVWPFTCLPLTHNSTAVPAFFPTKVIKVGFEVGRSHPHTLLLLRTFQNLHEFYRACHFQNGLKSRFERCWMISLGCWMLTLWVSGCPPTQIVRIWRPQTAHDVIIMWHATDFLTHSSGCTLWAFFFSLPDILSAFLNLRMRLSLHGSSHYMTRQMDACRSCWLLNSLEQCRFEDL